MKFVILTKDGLADAICAPSVSSALEKLNGARSTVDVIGIFAAEIYIAEPPSGHRGAYVALTGEPVKTGGGES